MPRQHATIPSAKIPPAESKAKRNRDFEKENRTGEYRQVSFRHIPLELRDDFTALALNYHVSVDDLGRFALEYFLESVRKGAVEITPEFSRGKRSLYPE